MTAPWEEAQQLQRPLPAGVLQMVSVGNKEDPPPEEEDGPPDGPPVQASLF